MRKFKKEIMIAIETKACQMKVEKEKEKCMRSYYCKRKNLLSHFLIVLKNQEMLVLVNKFELLKKQEFFLRYFKI